MKSKHSMNYHGLTPHERKQLLIEFYKDQYRKFIRIGVDNKTEFGVTVTNKLLKSTANRLDQLITGKKTKDNMCGIEKGMFTGWKGKTLLGFTNSNRSFLGYINSKFHLKDLELTQQHEVCNYIDYSCSYPHNEPQYIDKITTAYNSEIMRAVLSHNN